MPYIPAERVDRGVRIGSAIISFIRNVVLNRSMSDVTAEPIRLNREGKHRQVFPTGQLAAKAHFPHEPEDGPGYISTRRAVFGLQDKALLFTLDVRDIHR